MSFKITSYRILKPTPALEALCERYSQSSGETYSLLLEPEVLSFPDNSHHAHTHLTIYKLKVMYLVNLYTDFAPETVHGTSIYNLIREICGEPPFTGETFDKWWELVYTAGVDKFEDYESILRDKPELAKLVARTGNKIIDQWIEGFTTKPIPAENLPNPEDNNEQPD